MVIIKLLTYLSIAIKLTILFHIHETSFMTFKLSTEHYSLLLDAQTVALELQDKTKENFKLFMALCDDDHEIAILENRCTFFDNLVVFLNRLELRLRTSLSALPEGHQVAGASVRHHFVACQEDYNPYKKIKNSTLQKLFNTFISAPLTYHWSNMISTEVPTVYITDPNNISTRISFSK